jgi:hypothetical protein
MRRRWMFLVTTVVLSTVAVASCEQGTNPQADPELAPAASHVTLPGGGSPVITADWFPGASTSQLVSVAGGVIRLPAGHTISIPRGAVSDPTIFTMIQIPGRTLEVYLTALSIDSRGRIVNVGVNGFRTPVTLTLNYAAVSRLPVAENRLVILRRLRGGYEALPTQVDARRKNLTADLDHFSGYIMGAN